MSSTSWCHPRVTKSAISGHFRLQRGVEDGEPARQILLDRKLGLQLRLQLELFGVVAFLLPGRHEGPKGAPLVAVDPVDGMLPALEAEHGGEKLRPEPLLLEPGRNPVDGCDLVLEVGIANDDPGVSERVLPTFELRAGLGGNGVQKLLKVVLGADELAGRERLETDSAHPGRAQPELRLERHRCSRKREQPFTSRPRELLLAEEDVAKSHQKAASTSAAPRSARDHVAPLPTQHRLSVHRAKSKQPRSPIDWA